MSNWIPISERLPTREDADERGEVVWKWADGTTCTGRFEDGGEEQDPAVAWHPLPPYTPPELMPTNEECDQLAQNIWASRWSAARDTGIPVIRAWFVDVTARIEKEKGE